MLRIARLRWNDRSLRVKGTIFLSIPMTGLLLLGAAASLSEIRQQRAGDDLALSMRVRDQLDLVYQDILNAETGVRGFVLSGRPEFLQPYLEGIASIDGDFQTLRELEGDGEWDVAQLAKIESLIERRLTILAKLRDGAPYPSGVPPALLDRGKDVMDQIRAVHDDLASEENALLSERRASDHTAERVSLLTIILGVALGLFGGLLAIMLFTKGIARRVGRNEENAKRLERGDPLLPPPDGLDEVGRSGRAFEIAAAIIADREAQLLESTEQLRDLYNGSASGYHSLDRDGVYVLANDTELGWLGYTREEVIGKKRLLDVLTRTSRERFLVEFPAFIERGSVSDLELELRRKDGTTMTISLSATAVFDDTGDFVMSRSTLIDITARHSAEENAGHYRKQLERSNAELQEMQDELRRLATIDELTGLYNLRGFIPLAEHQLRLSDRSGTSAALMFMDLDGLKRVNDQFGHDEGSALIVEAVDVIQEVLRTSDIIARYGGDEFCALLTGGDESVEAVSRRLLEVITRRNASATRPYELSLSLGTAIYQPGDGVTVEDLIRRADHLMYEQKAAKKVALVS